MEKWLKMLNLAGITHRGGDAGTVVLQRIPTAVEDYRGDKDGTDSGAFFERATVSLEQLEAASITDEHDLHDFLDTLDWHAAWRSL